MSNSVCVAVDVGFGFTKCSFRKDPDEDPTVQSFPSVVALATDIQLDGGVLGKRNTERVKIGGTTYEVGPDVRLAVAGQRKVVHSDYVQTPDYQALIAGALWQAGHSSVDLLVVGLPVSQIPAQQDRLKLALTGFTVRIGESFIQVNEVLVLAQPVGGLIDIASNAQQYKILREAANLIIDPGYLTTDWVVAKGLQPVMARCGTHDGGMHAVLRQIAAEISTHTRRRYDDLDAIEDGLVTGSFRLDGQPFDLSEALASVRPVQDAAVHALKNSVGVGTDLDNIVVVGGAAPFWLDAIKQQFPRHDIKIASDPMFANARGYLLAGEHLLKREVVI